MTIYEMPVSESSEGLAALGRKRIRIPGCVRLGMRFCGFIIGAQEVYPAEDMAAPTY